MNVVLDQMSWLDNVFESHICAVHRSDVRMTEKFGHNESKQISFAAPGTEEN